MLDFILKFFLKGVDLYFFLLQMFLELAICYFNDHNPLLLVYDTQVEEGERGFLVFNLLVSSAHESNVMAQLAH